MVSTAQRHAAFPKMILGLKCSRHRVNSMGKALGYYQKRIGNAAEMAKLPNLVMALEDEVDRRDGDVRNLRRSNKARGIESDEKPKLVIPNKECSACMDELCLHSFPPDKLAVQYQHETTICCTCLAQSINIQLADVVWDPVQFPECSEALSFDLVREWASGEAFERYGRKVLIYAFQDVPNFTVCLGPGCDSGQIHGRGDDLPMMTCCICYFKTCYIYQISWRSEKICAICNAGRRDRIKQEVASENMIIKTTKPCANPECKAPIEKNDGCGHLSCKRLCAY
ncbi:hypothetical protein BUE80_DR005338 [Diplocarpon rosae]|nr:hypothetical protein BUE80_DR005338 [Diplocarpon rosae]